MVIPFIILISMMSALSRASGGGLGAHHLDKINSTWLPEAIFALMIGFACAIEYGAWFILSSIPSYIAMQAGHGTFYNMRGWESSSPNRIQTIEYVIRPIFKLFNLSIYTPAYSWACMGLKGFLIGLPLFPFGLLLAFWWPFSYSVKNSEWGEYLSGAFTGLCIVLLLAL